MATQAASRQATGCNLVAEGEAVEAAVSHLHGESSARLVGGGRGSNSAGDPRRGLGEHRLPPLGVKRGSVTVPRKARSEALVNRDLARGRPVIAPTWRQTNDQLRAGTRGGTLPASTTTRRRAGAAGVSRSAGNGRAHVRHGRRSNRSGGISVGRPQGGGRMLHRGKRTGRANNGHGGPTSSVEVERRAVSGVVVVGEAAGFCPTQRLRPAHGAAGVERRR